MSFGGGFSIKGVSGGGYAPSAPGPGWSASSDSPKVSVELTVAAVGLEDRDVMSKSDPVCVFYVQDKRTKKYIEYGRTETISNSLDPQWTKTFFIDYRFEERQGLKFVIFDSDCDSSHVQDHDTLGFIECTLGEIVSNQSRGFNKTLNDRRGSIKIFSQEVGAGNNQMYTFQFSAKNLDNKDFFSKSDPLFEINRITNGALGPLVYRTEVIDNNLNPTWKQFSIDSRKLNNNDDKLPLMFSVFDYDDDGSHDLIGQVQMSMEEMLSTDARIFPVINQKKKTKKGSKYKDSGVLVLNSVTIQKNHSFLDYIQSGLQMNFTVAIDFTGSNGNPQRSDSLHYIRADVDNQYSLAIKSVGEIIQDYDSDNQFPCLGFGARIPPNGEVSHDFFLNLNPNSPYCAGITGILTAYHNCINSVQLYGPTNFSPVIEHVAQFARAYHGQGEPSNYFVLLIITDGIITDMEDTKRSIVAAASLPMSIIIVGVGNEDFSAMEELDGDERRLCAGGRACERDIVQFVELRRFAGHGTWSKEALGASVLAELPSQVVAYMNKIGYKPKQ